MLQQTPSTIQLNMIQQKVAGRQFGFNGNILVIVEVSFISMTQKVRSIFKSRYTTNRGNWDSIGGRFDGSRAFKGVISAMEIYVGSNNRLADVIRNLMISRHMVKREVKEEPYEEKENGPITE